MYCRDLLVQLCSLFLFPVMTHSSSELLSLSLLRLWRWGRAASALLYRPMILASSLPVLSRCCWNKLTTRKERGKKVHRRPDRHTAWAWPHPLPHFLLLCLPKTAPRPCSTVDQRSEGPVSIVASGLAAEAPVPAPAEHAVQRVLYPHEHLQTSFF